MTHPILKKAEHILRQHAAGLLVSEDDLDSLEWAVQIALLNRRPA